MQPDEIDEVIAAAKEMERRLSPDDDTPPQELRWSAAKKRLGRKLTYQEARAIESRYEATRDPRERLRTQKEAEALADSIVTPLRNALDEMKRRLGGDEDEEEGDARRTDG